MKTLEELKRQQAGELAKFEIETAWRESLPEAFRENASLCIHDDHVSLTLWGGFRTDKKLSDACAVVEHYKGSIVDGEHWKDGCVSTQPAEINANAKRDNSTLEGSHAVEVSVHGGKGFGPDVVVEFWIKTELGLAEVHCAVCDLWKLVPRVKADYNRSGELTSCEIEWPVSGCFDSFRSWWSEKPGFKGSYYWADLPNFESFASQHLQAKDAAA